jgi:DNA-directed RNA polymerase subunit L
MEIHIIESSKNKLVFDLKGEGHALCNAVKKELWNDSDVNISGYHIEHPQVGVPRITVETKKGSKTPQKAVQDACKRLLKQNEQFLEKFKKEVK